MLKMSLKIILFQVIKGNNLSIFTKGNFLDTNNNSTLFYFIKTDSSNCKTSSGNQIFFELRIFHNQKEIENEFIKSLIVTFKNKI